MVGLKRLAGLTLDLTAISGLDFKLDFLFILIYGVLGIKK